VSDILLTVHSSCSGVVGDGVVLLRHLHKTVLNLVKEGDPDVMPSLLEWLPSQVSNHGRDWGLRSRVSVWSVLHKSSCTTLYHLNLVNILFLVGIPDGCEVFQLRADCCLVGLFFELLGALAQCLYSLYRRRFSLQLGVVLFFTFTEATIRDLGS